MKKLSKIIRSGAYQKAPKYAELLAAYQASRTAHQDAKAAYSMQKQTFQQAMKEQDHDAVALFEMHGTVKKLRFFRKISLLEKLAAKHALKAWLSEAAKNKKLKSEKSPPAATAKAAIKPSKKAEKKAKPAAEPADVADAPIAVVPVIAELAAVPDDLKKIEGIGPAIAKMLETAGIATFAQLAECTAESLREILGQNSRYKMHDPSTWPQQARMAAEGQWEALKSWQQELKAGKAAASH